MNMQDDSEAEIASNSEVPRNSTAVSLFGQSNNSNDFPVLKAFQEYINAEQAKARKRVVGLSAFFILLLLVVVITFTLILTAFITRNQALSDKLLDIALNERNRNQAQPLTPVVTVQQPPASQPIVQAPVTPQVSSDANLKPVLEQIEKLTEAVTKSQQPVTPTPVLVTTAPAPQPVAVAMSPTESAEMIRLREELRKQQEALKEEKKKQKEAEHKAEVEKFLRHRYPEYYARQDARRTAEAHGDRAEGDIPPPPHQPVVQTVLQKTVETPQIQPSVVEPPPAPSSQPTSQPVQTKPIQQISAVPVQSAKPAPQAAPVPTGKSVPQAVPVPAGKPVSPSPEKPKVPPEIVIPKSSPTPVQKPTTTSKPERPVTMPETPSQSTSLDLKSIKPIHYFEIKEDVQSPAPRTNAVPVSANPRPPSSPSPVKQTVGAEAITVGTSSTNSIQWLLEEQPAK